MAKKTAFRFENLPFIETRNFADEILEYLQKTDSKGEYNLRPGKSFPYDVPATSTILVMKKRKYWFSDYEVAEITLSTRHGEAPIIKIESVLNEETLKQLIEKAKNNSRG